MNEQKVVKPIALIKTGCTIAKIKPQHGDFEDWFAEGMGIPDLLQVDVFRHSLLPAAEKLSGIVITGSAAMVSAREAWSERCAEWLQRAVQTGVPVLGVCYGHQLLAHALGGLVGPNPAGRQIGTVTARLTGASDGDDLLGQIPRSFAVQASHSEAVLELPPGAQRLAVSPLDDNFVIRFAESVWGLQFHPEFSASVMSEYVRNRSDVLREEGLSPTQVLNNITDTEDAKSILRKFAELIAHNSKTYGG